MGKDFEVVIENGAYRVTFPYSPRDVDALKRYIPSTGRTWDPARKCWIIAADQKRNAETALGMTFPVIMASAPVKETRLLEVRYLGACKERAPGEVSAMGLLPGGAWGVIFPLDTLTAWFEDAGQASQSAPQSLYAILGARQTDDAEAIKTAYRRMAKQWHPDVNHDQDAHKMFLRIREAYDILSNIKMRLRYDAGLALEATINKNIDKGSSLRMDSIQISIYRAPLTNGYILAEGINSIGRFVVSSILGWEEITRQDGKVMVSSWKNGDKNPTFEWA